MLEEGHFRELRQILNFIYVSKAKHLKLIKTSNEAETQPKLKDFLKSQKQENSQEIKYQMKMVEGSMDPALLQDIKEAELIDEEADEDEHIIVNSDDQKEALHQDDQTLWKSVNGRQLDIQTFISSATLTLDGAGEAKRRKKVQEKLEKKVEQLYQILKFRGKPVLINLTASQLYPEKQIKQEFSFCKNTEEKEILLYYLLQDQKSTIVFLNALGSAKKLVSLLRTLRLEVNLLHAKMQQRQRLKQLQSFKARITKGDKALMVATDVAARGLHIPSVEHIIHFQVAKSPELYVHRIGRSARLTNAGHSICLVNPEEVGDFKRIYKSLKAELNNFKVGESQLAHFKDLVSKARVIEKQAHQEYRAQEQEKWTKKLVQETGLDPDDADHKVIKREEKIKTKQVLKNRQKDKEEFKSLMAGKDILSKSTFLSPAKLKYLNSLGDQEKPVRSSPFLRHRVHKSKSNSKQRHKKRKKGKK